MGCLNAKAEKPVKIGPLAAKKPAKKEESEFLNPIDPVLN